MWLAIANTVLLIAILAVIGLGLVEYIKLKRVVTHIRHRMNCDELLDQLIAEDTGAVPADGTSSRTPTPTEQGSIAHSVSAQQQARLAAVVAGGQAREYLGKQVTVAEVEEMEEAEIAKLYRRYEARLGATMTKTLGASALQMYALAAGTILPIPPENRPGLVQDLESDPFVGHALTTACCELYHCYGMYLAPLTALLTTAKHCQIGQTKHDEQSYGESGGNTCSLSADVPSGEPCSLSPGGELTRRGDADVPSGEPREGNCSTPP